MGNILNQLSSIIKKGFIKYTKTNDINYMGTQIEFAHLHLVTKKPIDNSMARLSNQIGLS
jgi:hypothetical protein